MLWFEELIARRSIGQVLQAKQRQSDVSEDPELRATITKSYELCNAAANHITSIGTLRFLHIPILLTFPSLKLLFIKKNI